MIRSRWPSRWAAIAPSKVDGEDPLVLGQQVVGELVEVADPADHRGRGHDLVAVGGELGARAPRPWRRPRRSGSAGGRRTTCQAAVLAEVVEPDDLVAGLEQLGDEVAVDEPGRAGDEDPHSRAGCPSPRAPHTSTTSLPPTLEAAVRLVRRAEDQDVALLEDAFERSRAGRPRRTDRCASTRAPAHDSSLRSL